MGADTDFDGFGRFDESPARSDDDILLEMIIFNKVLHDNDIQCTRLDLIAQSPTMETDKFLNGIVPLMLVQMII